MDRTAQGRDNLQRRSAVMPSKPQLPSNPGPVANANPARRQIVSMDSGIDVLVLNFYYDQLFRAKEAADKQLKEFISYIDDKKSKIFTQSTVESLVAIQSLAKQLLNSSAEQLVGGRCQDIIGEIFALKKERVYVSRAASVKVRSRTVGKTDKKDTEKDRLITKLLMITSQFSLIVSSLDIHDHNTEDFKAWTSRKFEKESSENKGGIRVSASADDVEICRICENQLPRSQLRQHTFACVELQGIEAKIDYCNTNLEKAFSSLETELQTSSRVAIKEPKNEIEEYKNNFLQSVSWLSNTLSEPIRKLQHLFDQLSMAYYVQPLDLLSLGLSLSQIDLIIEEEDPSSGLKELSIKVRTLELMSIEICFAVTSSRNINSSTANLKEEEELAKGWKIENTSKHGDVRDVYEGSLSTFFEDTYSSLTKMERVLVKLNQHCAQIIQFEVQHVRSKLSLRDILATIIKKFNRLVEKYAEISKFLLLKKQIPEEMMEKKVDVTLQRRKIQVAAANASLRAADDKSASLRLPSPRADGSRSPRGTTQAPVSPRADGPLTAAGKLTMENWLRATKKIVEKFMSLPTNTKTSLADCEKFITQLTQLINLKDKINENKTGAPNTTTKSSASDLTTAAVLANILRLMKDKQQLLMDIHQNQRLQRELYIELQTYYQAFLSKTGTKKGSRHSITDFDIVKPISRGAYGAVFLAQKKSTGDIYAIKTLKKQETILKNQAKFVDNERNILSVTDNPFVVKLFYTFQSQYHLYMVMEYLPGGDLFSLLKNLGSFEEATARVYIAEIILALEYLHNNNIIHRDLKPDNILINRTGHIKLTDFGLSAVGLLEKQDRLRSSSINPKRASVRPEEPAPAEEASAVGTPEYMAPELLLGMGGGKMVDVWALGCILYEFLVGLTPFYGDSIQDVFQNILDGNIMWPEEEEFSNDAQDVICKLLICSPSDRITIADLKKHVWFKPVNWDTVLSTTPPFVPQFDDLKDTSYFEARNEVFAFDDKLLNDILQSEKEADPVPPSFGEPGSGDGSNNNPPPQIFRKFSYTSLNHLASVNQSIAARPPNPPNRPRPK